MIEQHTPDFLQRVNERHELFSTEFRENEEVRVCSSNLLVGDFDRAAVRIAEVLDNGQSHKPIKERIGRRHFSSWDIKFNWKLFKARYFAIGSMTQDEKSAFDTLLDDMEFSKSVGMECSLVRLLYSNLGSKEIQFHQDFGGKSRLLRAYNHSAMSVTDRSNVVADKYTPNSFSVIDERQVIPIQIGDYTLHRMKEEGEEEGGIEYSRHGAYHIAKPKKSGAIPRLLLCCDL